MSPNTPGPHLQALETALTDKAGFEVAFTLAMPTGAAVAYRLTCYTYSTALTTTPGTRQLRAVRWPAALAELASQRKDAVPRLESVSVRGVKRPAEVRQLLGLALCELFGRPVPDEKELARQRRAAREVSAARVSERARALRQPGGVAAWNALPLAERKEQGRFDGADLSGARLAGIDLSERSAIAANFARATLADGNLIRAVLRRADLTRASLRRARLLGADLAGVRAEGANLSEARLVQVRLDRADLRGARLRKASLHQAPLFDADLTDADLTDADLTDAVAGRTRYNAGTRFPAGFVPGSGWVYFGLGVPAGDEPTPAGLDFDGLLACLPTVVPERCLQAAQGLLRLERPQLFAEVEAGQVAGVVRSRFDRARINTCRLTAEGCFSCGSVRLRSCGGQHGAVCGHLLALVLGLVRAGRFDADRANL